MSRPRCSSSRGHTRGLHLGAPALPLPTRLSAAHPCPGEPMDTPKTLSQNEVLVFKESKELRVYIFLIYGSCLRCE